MPQSREELASPRRKICSWDAARDWRERASGIVVFTNGVFDLLHPGHVDLLAAARSQGDHLVVGVNSDASVRRLEKGSGRPVRTQDERAHVLAGLEAVDAVVIFDEDTPLELVRHLHPDVIVKGGDYTPQSVVGAVDVLRLGGRVVIIPTTPGQSTTSIIEKIRGASKS